MSVCEQCGAHSGVGHTEACDAYRKKGSASDDKSTSSDDRLYGVITIRLYDDARRERVVDEFGVSTWLTPKQFHALKEQFVEEIRCAAVLEEIEMTTELMK